MKGLIMCGGQSSRMGQDKGLLNAEDKAWASISADILYPFSNAIKYSINESQVASYSNIFPPKDFVIDNNLIPFKGPLCGLLSAHLQFPNDDFLVLACDMPEMHEVVFSHLVKSKKESDEAVCFQQVNGQIEPLVGFYSAKGLAKIWQMVQENQLEKNSMFAALSKLQTQYISIPQNWEMFFKNFNTPLDS